MHRIQQIIQSRWYTLFGVIFVLGLFSVNMLPARLFAAPPKTDSAFNQKQIKDLSDYCSEKFPKKAREACSDNTLMAQLANNVSSKCGGALHSEEHDGCVTKLAKKGIANAAEKADANTKPSKAKDLMKTATAIVTADAEAPADSSGASNDGQGPNPDCDDSKNLCDTCDDSNGGCANCDGGQCSDPAADSTLTCKDNDDDAQTNGGQSTGYGCNIVKKYVNPGINLLSGIFGLIAVISLILAGIQYTNSVGDPQKVSSAKARIYKTLFAIVAYFFFYAFLNFLIPGGIFK